MTCPDPEHETAIAAAIRLLQNRLTGPGALITVHNTIPAHQGFGSKTLTVLAVARAYTQALSG